MRFARISLLDADDAGMMQGMMYLLYRDYIPKKYYPILPLKTIDNIFVIGQKWLDGMPRGPGFRSFPGSRGLQIPLIRFSTENYTSLFLKLSRLIPHGAFSYSMNECTALARIALIIAWAIDCS